MNNEELGKLLQQQQKILQHLTNLVGNQTCKSVPPFQPFNAENECWSTYIARTKEHLKAQGVETSLYKPLLLSWIGTESYQLYEKLFSEKDRLSCTFDEIVLKIKEYLSDRDYEVSSMVKFANCRMQPCQSYSQWATDLEAISRKCNFRCENCKTSYAPRLIRDIIILHTPHPRVQVTCIEQRNPQLQEVINIGDRHLVTKQAMAHIRDEVPSAETEVKDINQLKPQYKKSKGVSNPKRKKLQSCTDCFVSHDRINCPHRRSKCNHCHRTGHIENVCYSKQMKKKPKQEIRQVNQSSGDPLFHINKIQALCHGESIYLNLNINNKVIHFQIDTGASRTIIDRSTYTSLGKPKLRKTSTTLMTYGGSPLPTLGECTVNVQHKNCSKKLTLLVVKHSDSGNLIGMDWLTKLKDHINLQSSSRINSVYEQAMIKEHPKVFSSDLGCYRYGPVKLHVKKSVEPISLKARPVPFSLLSMLKHELQRLESIGVITKVSHSEWSTPIVIVRKSNDKLRVCGDFKATINRALKIDQYPIPRPEELYLKLRGGQRFSKIDLSEAYFQLELDKESRKYTTIATIQGLYEYNRLPFGIASAPAIFQRIIEQLVSDLPLTAAYLDDIIVTGKNTEEHIANLNKLFAKLADAGLTCKKDKCQLFQKQVTYLGRIIDAEGIRPSDDNVQVIKQLPAPKDLSQLMPFLGKADFYRKFVPNFADTAEPLNKLRRASKIFRWTKEEEDAFLSIKQAIINATSLTHYDPEKTVVLSTDASGVGVGAVLLHRCKNGNELPIAHASKTLTNTQRNYSQIEREALAIIYGIKKFHQYLYGTEFIIITDHQPLLSLFSPTKKTSVTTTQRLQRWSLLLSNYKYSIEYRSSKRHGNADALSRLPVGHDDKFDEEEETNEGKSICHIKMISSFPLNIELIQKVSVDDPVTQELAYHIRKGWPRKIKKNFRLKNFYNIRHSLSTKDGIVFVEYPILKPVIPERLRANVLKQLHQGHMGIEKMKRLARRLCYWPNISNDIHQLVKRCVICQSHADNPPKQYQCWPYPKQPWERVHIDFAGLFKGYYWLILVDSYSKFPYVIRLANITAKTTIKALEHIFSIEGCPHTVVSDNGTQLVSKEFEKYLRDRNIQHVTTPPYHPASNGQAERFVRSFKKCITKLTSDNKGLDEALIIFLNTYRFTPSMDGQTPAEKLHGHRAAHIRPLIEKSEIRPGKFNEKDNIYFRTDGNKCWKRGKIVRRLGKITYLIQSPFGKMKVHQNQLLKRYKTPVLPPLDMDDIEQCPMETNSFLISPQTCITDRTNPAGDTDHTSSSRPRPRRIRKTPKHLQDYVLT